MRMKKKDYANWYNCQIVEENGIIIWNYVDNSSNDVKTLIPTMERIKNNFKDLPNVLLADKWYPSVENFEYLENNKINWYIPLVKTNDRLKDYKYNEIEDTYEDKKGNLYKFKWYSLNRNGKKILWIWEWREIKEEDYRYKKYSAKLSNGRNSNLEINKDWQRYRVEQISKLATLEWIEIYKDRQGAEIVFGNIKHNLWFTRFLLRWLEKVRIEWNLINIVHNLKKIMKFRAI
jgi:transposase